MTMRERMLALAQGREHDRVPFAQYSFLAAPDDEIWEAIGRDNMGLLQWTNVHRLQTPNCYFDTEDVVLDGKKGFCSTLHTPEGDLREHRLIEPTYGTSAVAAHYVKSPEDYGALMAYFRDMQVHKDIDGYRQVVRSLGSDGLPHTAVERTPFQQLWVQWVNLQDLCVHLVECEQLMEEVFALMTDVQRRVFEVTCQAVAELADTDAAVPYIDVPDNITAPAIGRTYFQKYCVPAYDELAGMLDETGQDVPVFVHMDGDLKPLREAIAESRVRGLDSMSPPPDNDTSVADALAQWPDMRVCVNFPSSVHLAPPEKVYARTMEILEQGGRSGRLQIQISENVPPGVWARSFPQIVQAINDFG